MHNCYILLGVLLSHAPDNNAQELMSTMYSTMMKYRLPVEVEKTLAHMLSNGLNHDNWPWTEPAYENQN